MERRRPAVPHRLAGARRCSQPLPLDGLGRAHRPHGREPVRFVKGGFVLSYLAATDGAIAAKRPVLQDFLQRVVKAQRWSYDNVDAYSAALARIIGIPPEAAKLQFERRQQKWVAIDAQVVADQQATADFYRQVGLIKQPLDVKGTFDTGFSVAG
jgi:ABC-type nitrate/sulfonate/bicarbonate transport system substrate-binding protein